MEKLCEDCRNYPSCEDCEKSSNYKPRSSEILIVYLLISVILFIGTLVVVL